MKKVLFLIPNLAHGGAERVLVNLLNNIDKSVFEVSLQTLFDVGVNKKHLASTVHYVSGYKYCVRGNSHIMKLFSPKWLYKHFIKGKYDIIVSFLEGPTARIISGCLDSNVKLVNWIHIEQGNKKIASRSFRSFTEAKNCYQKYNKIVFVSETVKQDFESIFGVSNCGIVLYNVVESQKIIETSNQEIVDLKMQDDVFNIVSVAKIVHSKGYDRLMRIHKKLLSEGIKNHVYILGIGEELNAYKRYLKDNNLEDSFTFLGFRDNPYKYVKQADLYVCSSRREGFSTAVTESLIVGTPVVSTNCSGAYELLGKNNEYGIVTDNSEESLFLGIKKMLTTPNLLENYAQKALERGKYFSTEKTTKAVEDMLLNL